MKQYFPAYIVKLVWAVFVMIGCNLCLIGWLTIKKEELKFASEDLSRCKNESAAIVALRQLLPAQTPSDGQDSSEVSNVRSALVKANIAESSIQSVAVRGRSPIKKTAFEKVDTTLVLKNVLLREALNFIDTYEQENSDSVCSKLEIRLSDTQTTNAGVIDVADFTLTQIVRANKN